MKDRRQRNVPYRLKTEPADIACRNAVLPGFVRSVTLADLYSANFVRRATTRISVLRGKLLRALRTLKYKPVLSDYTSQQIDNCPPPYLWTSEGVCQCNRYLICPFCWCRRVTVPLYTRFESRLFPPNSSRTALSDRDYQLLYVRHVLPAEQHGHDNTYATYAAKQQLLTDRSFFRRTPQVLLGSVHLGVIQPVPGTDTQLDVRIQTLFLLSREADVTTINKYRDTCSLSTRGLSRPRLAMWVGRLSRFPAGLLLGNPKLVKQILQARGEGRGTTLRLLRCKGLLYTGRALWY